MIARAALAAAVVLAALGSAGPAVADGAPVNGSVGDPVASHGLRAERAGVDGCPVTGATLSWGFKESFRSYISGTIARGQWTVLDGATYSTPSFGFADGAGGYDGVSGAGEVAFAGGIEFTGHGGILDTTIARPVLHFVDGGRAELAVDVRGTTQGGDAVVAAAVPFATLDLAGSTRLDGSMLVIDAAPTTLTAEGAAAFGTYPAGEPLDPVSARLPLQASCAAVAPVPPPVWPWWIAGGAAGVIALAVGAVVLVRGRRRRMSTSPESY